MTGPANRYQKAVDAFALYTDRFGLIQPYPRPNDGASGNGLRYTSEAYLELARLGGDLADLEGRFSAAVASCEIRPGLYRRHPTNPHQNAWDDYAAIATTSAHLGSTHALAILAYGLSHAWTFNNVRSGSFAISAWFGRFPAFVAHIHYAARVRPSRWLRFAWCAAVVLSAFAKRGNQDAWIITWGMVQTLKRFALTEALSPELTAARFFEWRMWRVWRRGLSDAYESYFQNSQHPLARFWA